MHLPYFSVLLFYIKGTSNSFTTAIWIINERNSISSNIDVHQTTVRIMWYRFLLIISKYMLFILCFVFISMSEIERDKEKKNTLFRKDDVYVFG